MCLATVYKAREPESVLFQFVSRIDVEGDIITLTDVMGEKKTVRGSIQTVDLAKSTVEINCLD